MEYLSVLLLLLLAWWIRSVQVGHSLRLDRVDVKLDKILEHLEIEWNESELPVVRSLLAKGDRLGAIRAYREATGAGLAEAKKAVEGMRKVSLLSQLSD